MSILRLALNSIAGLSTDIYSAVTSVTEAIRNGKILDPDQRASPIKIPMSTAIAIQQSMINPTI
jgi:hypothetical protein